MAWFRRPGGNIADTQQQRDLPDGLWKKCDGCGELLYLKQLEENAYTCSKCNHHFRIGSREYIHVLLDPGSFVESHRTLRSKDPLGFVDSKPYPERIEQAGRKTGLYDALRVGLGTVEGLAVSCAVMDFSFVGGSMGSVVGEKFARAADSALERRIPFISVSASGGARMQEGALSLMQLAKTSAKIAQLSDARIPFISILTDPTTGGVSASFAMLGDVNIAEPGALIGFAGPRVIEQTIRKKLPPGFQRSEFLLEHGFVDAIVHRRDMRHAVATLVRHFQS
jgi:acetyl-CoA carboxylase carboxyl transferase subunit beta